MTGNVPNFTTSTLQNLYLNNNRLSGNIPNLNLPSLNQLYLYANQLSGCFPSNIQALCAKSVVISQNPLLPYQGDFSKFCVSKTQISAPCDDGNPTNFNDIIQADCSCKGSLNPCRQNDSLELVKLYTATNGANWTNKWDLLKPITTWFGIKTTMQGCVEQIDLDGVADFNSSNANANGNNLVGTLPDLKIENLIVLNVTGNKLTGNLPNFALPKLSQLFLSSNQFTGTIPNFNLPSLSYLYLYSNQFTGTIPNFNLPNLYDINLSNNLLSGIIPNFNLPRLYQLALGTNQLIGTIPIFNLPNLTELFLSNNQLTGEAGNLNTPNLVNLYLNDNKLTSISPQIGQLTALKYIQIANNRLIGNIPTSIGNLKTLIGLTLNGNQLSGTLPTSILALPKIRNIDVAYNRLTNLLTFNSNNGLGDFTNLNIYNNQLTFEDILPSIPFFKGKGFGYFNQANIFSDTLIIRKTGEPLTINLGVDDTVSTSIYQWSKYIPNTNGVNTFKTIKGSNKLTFDKLLPTDAGKYFCNVTNPNATNLTLRSYDINIQVRDNDVFVEIPELRVAQGADGCVGMQVKGFKNIKSIEFTVRWVPSVFTYKAVSEFALPSLGASNFTITNVNNGVLSVKWQSPTGAGVTLTDGSDLFKICFTATGLAGNVSSLYFSTNTNETIKAATITTNIIPNTSNGTLIILSDCRKRDSLTLVKMYPKMNGNEWATTWNFQQPLTKWQGITLNAAGCVTGLNLSGTLLSYSTFTGNNVSGILPPEVGDLSFLQTLDIRNNPLTGNIPPEIGKLTALQTLWLNNNKLTGRIPVEIGNLQQVTTLDLSGNQLTDTIPASIGKMKNLNSLGLGGNSLTGTLPKTLGDLANLQSLSIGGTKLTGTIPDELGNLANLTYLFLGNNKLTGNIPIALGKLKKLTALYLFSNQLIGKIPAELGNLSELYTLNLSSNQLTDTIPRQLSSLTKLQQLGLSNNQLKGSIPTTFGNLKILYELSVANNKLSGKLPNDIGNWTNLSALYLYNNEFSGDLPVSIWNLKNLVNVNIENNQFTGAIPDAMLNLTKLRLFNMTNNNFTRIPNLNGINFGIANNEGLYVGVNKLTFKDILPNKPLFNLLKNNANYTNQKKFGIDTTLTSIVETPLTIDLMIDDTVTTNTYTWYKTVNNTRTLFKTIKGTNKLPLGNVSKADEGIYTCTVTNSKVTDLTLQSSNIVVKVICPPKNQAFAGTDQRVCNTENINLVAANLPNYASASGKWVALTGAALAQNNTTNTTANKLRLGSNLFSWTLSTKECSAYSSDSVAVVVENAPKLKKDETTNYYQVPSIEPFNIFSNDDFQYIGKWDLVERTMPKHGQLDDLGNGKFSFTPERRFLGKTSFMYKICNNFCPTLCDTALVTIKVILPEDISAPIGITLNGDGANDVFIIPYLGDNPMDYPKNELHIYNRYGDTVYHAAPYKNDWGGWNENGAIIPQATYYFILKLDDETPVKVGRVVILK